ncbi:hypothetical protein [Arthrobacter sp. ES3-54]|uniref:DUF6993 domain-containing protein n=1 Tax=Arthrobacter sp. ES3-54 TaxID=1502991 RepID=UPI00240674F9|nr:hypothetical protein [Arthrobacter sp. ES3-54]
MQHARIAAGPAAAAAAGPRTVTTAAGGASRRGRAVPGAATVVLLLLLVLLPNTSACATPAGGSGVGGSGAGHSEGATSAASPAPSGPTRTGGTGTPGSDMKSKVESVLDAAVRGGGQPQTARIRESLVSAGIPAGEVEVTAGRTPTGLAAGAVEAGVRDGRSCIVAQIRNGSVTVGVLPVLASGGCLVGVQD